MNDAKLSLAAPPSVPSSFSPAPWSLDIWTLTTASRQQHYLDNTIWTTTWTNTIWTNNALTTVLWTTTFGQQLWPTTFGQQHLANINWPITFGQHQLVYNILPTTFGRQALDNSHNDNNSRTTAFGTAIFGRQHHFGSNSWATTNRTTPASWPRYTEWVLTALRFPKPDL